MQNKTLGVILASGFSKRMGQNKLLLHFKNMPISEYVIKACKNSNLSNTIIISRFDEIQEIARKYQITYISNEKAYLGQSESIKIAVNNAIEYDAIMFLSADTPLITSQVINKMLSTYNGEILSLKYQDKLTNPVIFPKRYFEDLSKLEGDIGGKSIILANKFDALDIDFYNKDIDTQEDFYELGEVYG